MYTHSLSKRQNSQICDDSGKVCPEGYRTCLLEAVECLKLEQVALPCADF